MQDDGQIVTRFAPSPTGFLHIGGARTALFNWLYTRRHGGRFRLRIEDTDRARSTEEAIDAIIEGLSWLGLDWDDEVVYQSRRVARHEEIAKRLLESGAAYYCYCTQEELQEMRDKARAEGRPPRYDGRWRDRDPSQAPAGVDPVIRLKAPLSGETVIDDLVQGSVRFGNEQLDDMVLLRADGSPTYMLSVVVDDHDMGITHVIRGDDHLNNAARQSLIFNALGWQPPAFAHIPLIHGPDGAKLSKRHGALGLDSYRDMGYLPQAMRNYLLRLGWSHGDEEIIPTQQAIDWFDLDHVGRSPARFDMAKLDHLNGHYMRECPDDELFEHVLPFVEKAFGPLKNETGIERLRQAVPGLKQRAKTLVELAENSYFCVAERPLQLDEKAQSLLDDEARLLLGQVADSLDALDEWTAEALENATRQIADVNGVKFGQIAQPLRAALTGRKTSPGIFDVLIVLGRQESLARIRDQAAHPAET